eukprot:91646_1
MATISVPTHPVILPDYFTLCTVLSEATSWVEFEFTDNEQCNQTYIDSEPDLDEQSISSEEEESEDDEDDDIDLDNTEDDDDDDVKDASRNYSNDHSQSEHEEEHSLHDIDHDHINIHHSISTLLQHQQVDLDQLFTQFEHLLHLRARSRLPVTAESDESTSTITEESTTEDSWTVTESTSEDTWSVHGSHSYPEYHRLPIQTKQDLIFLIATFTYRANESYNQNYFNVLKFYVTRYYSFEHLYIDDILSIIVSFIESTFRFCAESDECKNYNQKVDQVTFEHNRSIVRFNHAENDYLNIISESCVLDSNEGESDALNIVIHCLMLDKGDEFWIGFIDKNAFSIHRAVERRKGSLLYYGGRERLIGDKDTKGYSVWDNGFGAIHQAGSVHSEKLPSYSKGDWISFLIQKKEKHLLSIFKNGKRIYQTDTLPFMDRDKERMNALYFMCTVDDEVDAIFVEQAMYNNQIPFCDNINSKPIV